jgi:phosphoglycolate phosphatase-like HAD superfamily hydrolase
MKKLLLFDIDGTILSMKKGVSKNIFIDTFFDIFGIAPAMEQMPYFAGNTDLQILSQMAQEVGLDERYVSEKLEDFWSLKLERFKQYCTAEFVDIIPGIDSLLANISRNNDFELALLTGNSRKNAFQKLSSHGLDKYFQDGAFGCENADRNLLPPLAIERANQKINEPLFTNENTYIIGDTISDVLAAKTNHLKVMIIADEKVRSSFDDQPVDSFITDFSDQDYFYREIERISN